MEVESREEIEIIDEGIETENLDGPLGICCWGPFTPFRN